MSDDGESLLTNIPSNLNFDDLVFGTSAKTEQESFPKWAEFLFELGYWFGGLDDTGDRLFCTILLPSRGLASAIVAFGALSHSLRKLSDGISWESFLEFEPGTHVYFLYDLPKKGKRQLEGILGEVITYGNESLRQIHIKAKKKEHKNLEISLGKSRYREANVSLHPQHRTVLLNEISELASAFRYVLSTFNENRLLLSEKECLIVTNKAALERQLEGLFLFNAINSEHAHLFSELLMIKYGRVSLSAPRSHEIGCHDANLVILDGIDPLRSRDNVVSNKTLVLLEKNEFQEEAEDLIYSLSDYCDRNEHMEITEPPFICPEGIEIQLYVFSGRE